MTGIIYDGKTIAADTAIYNRKFVICEYACKIDKWSKGYFATAGASRDTEKFREWLEGSKDKIKVGKDFEALYSEDGKVFVIEKDLIPEPASVPTGIGVGGEYCEVLCRAGFTGKKALEEIMKYHTGVGGKVDVVKIDRT